ncbi:hypothetical protein Ais01nite_03680 [Asanoa ishikariensis]|uniref:DUF1579 domain-containing protein n=1 Tax=Asanoa ishikariensis TaxID=137265 RepID=A0A1H3TKP8_9ACTN|nr:hypothetical protein Ais01nite_03680 [Asanoa ishikariensis]SDZ50235.1 hypothetical protein SAMN05421684_5863 [Asanoa ishikariensis]
MFVVGLALIYPAKWLMHPWAAPWKPGLVGYWQGEVAFGSGDSRTMVLRLRDGVGGGDEGSEIGGSAKVCGAAQTETYEISGDARDYQGTSFFLNAQFAGDAAGLYLGRLEGAWDGHDGLTISTSLLQIDQDGAAGFAGDTGTGDTPTVRFELHRAGEADFAAACDS